MKYKLLAVNSDADNINIGDYIQALASLQFLPHFDGFINRERLDEYQGEQTKIIMNGWFMHKPHHWPPSQAVIPLFVAFHINKYTGNALFSKKSIEYFKLHEPIGCRDYNTVQQLEKHGVKAFFTGCMTLTLGEKYKSSEKENKCYFVDAYFNSNWSKIELFRNFFYYLRYKRNIDIIANKISYGLDGIRKKLRLVTFYIQYKKYFSEETLVNAEYISQMNSSYGKNFVTDEALLGEAERLIKLYSKAKLVVTSRIHCALPCLGMETSVVYIENVDQDEISSCRLQGLRELFNVMEWKKGTLTPKFNFSGKLSVNNQPMNKNNWKLFAQKLIKIVTAFIAK